MQRLTECTGDMQLSSLASRIQLYISSLFKLQMQYVDISIYFSIRFVKGGFQHRWRPRFKKIRFSTNETMLSFVCHMYLSIVCKKSCFPHISLPGMWSRARGQGVRTKTKTKSCRKDSSRFYAIGVTHETEQTSSYKQWRTWSFPRPPSKSIGRPHTAYSW